MAKVHVFLFLALGPLLIDCFNDSSSFIPVIYGTNGKRIVNGVPAKDLNFMVSFMISPKKGMMASCTGSIISATTVLTAAHCVQHAFKNLDKQIKIHVGTTKYTEGTKVVPKAVVVHHKWSGNNGNYMHDIAMIILNSPIKLSSKINTITPATKLVPPNTAVYAAGFGSTNKALYNPYGNEPVGKQTEWEGILYKVKLNVISTEKCLKLIGVSQQAQNNIKTQFCTQEKGKSTCSGDSGGPIFTSDKKTVIGVVSGGWGCADDRYPSVHTNVAMYSKWIEKAQKAGADIKGKKNRIIYKKI